MEHNIETLSVLRSIPLFLDLSQTQLQRISEISQEIEIDPGEILIQEGSQLDYLYIVLEGEIRVDIFVPTFGQIETSRLGPLDILGWSAMTPMVRQRTGTVTSLTHCWLLKIDGKSLCNLCEEDHDIGFVIYRRISNVVAHSFLSTRIQLMNLVTKASIASEPLKR